MTDEMSLTVFDPIKSQIAELTEKDSKLVFDHTTPDGEAQLRSYVRRLRSHKGTIADLHKTTKQGALAFGRRVDAIKNELTAGVQAIIDARMKPLDDIEDAKRKAAEAIVEAERVAKEQADADRLADLDRREKATAAKEAELETKQREAGQAEREKRIAAEATETATKLAEANAQIEADALKASIAAEAAKKQRKKDAADEAERKRISDRTHRSQIDAEVELALRRTGIGDDASHDVTMALVQGEIPHVTINY